MTNRILCIVPHLSTGGCPQYFLTKLKYLINNFDVKVIEYDNVSDEYTIQKNQIIELLNQDQFISLGQDKNILINIIKDFNPDIIHLEEMPEYFLSKELADNIYTINRKYQIYETSHDSSFDINNKKYFPNKFVFVSKYQIDLFKSLNIPMELVEYPLIHINKNKNQGLKNLGLNDNKFHIINIGLFTERKNQKEIINIAKFFLDKEIMFHFVGNTAPNFEYYWKPLLENLPKNCKLWGERKDVENFYNAADLFYFASKGNINNKETNPLVIREAISYNLPILLYNLDVYNGMYDNTDNVFFLSENEEDRINQINFFYNQWKIRQKNNLSIFNKKETFNNLYYSKDENKIYFSISKSLNNIRISIKDIFTKLVIHSYESDIIENLEYWVIPVGNLNFGHLNNFKGFLIEFWDQNNQLIESKELIINNKAIAYDSFIFNGSNHIDPTWYNYYEFFYLKKYTTLNDKINNTVIDIGANCGVFTRFALSKGAKKIYSIEPNLRAYNALVNNFSNDSRVIPIKKAIGKTTNQEVLYFCKENTTLCSMLKEQIDKIPQYKDGYDLEIVDVDTIENIIETQKISYPINLIKIDIEGLEYEVIEYLNDDVLINTEELIIELHHLSSKKEETKILLDKLNRLNFEIESYSQAGDVITDVINSNCENVILICHNKKNNTIKTKFKLKGVHLLSQPEVEREKKSILSIKQLERYGIKYKQNINNPYTLLPPKENCSRPNDISLDPGHMKLTPGHYGCYLAHKNAILNEWEEGLDGLLIFECDSVLISDPNIFIELLDGLYNDIEKYKIRLFSFGPAYNNEDTKDMGLYYISSNIYEMHAYLITKSNYQRVKELLETTPWDVFDIWVSDYLKGEKLGTIKNYQFMQAKGFSLLDKKESLNNWLGHKKV